MPVQRRLAKRAVDVATIDFENKSLGLPQVVGLGSGSGLGLGLGLGLRLGPDPNPNPNPNPNPDPSPNLVLEAARGDGVLVHQVLAHARVLLHLRMGVALHRHLG